MTPRGEQSHVRGERFVQLASGIQSHYRNLRNLRNLRISYLQGLGGTLCESGRYLASLPSRVSDLLVGSGGCHRGRLLLQLFIEALQKERLGFNLVVGF